MSIFKALATWTPNLLTNPTNSSLRGGHQLLFAVLCAEFANPCLQPLTHRGLSYHFALRSST